MPPPTQITNSVCPAVPLPKRGKFDLCILMQDFATCCRTIYDAADPGTRAILDFAVDSRQLPLIYSVFVHALLSVDTINSSPGAETVKVGLEDLDFENVVDLLCRDFRDDFKLFMSLYDPANREPGSLTLR